jgi:hypothetical protein
MSHPYYHSKSSVKRYKGKIEDYLPLHNFLDQSKAHIATSNHRMWLHNSGGCFLGEQVFGLTIKNSDGIDVPTRKILEDHILEDFGWIPTLAECLDKIPVETWMHKKAKRLSQSKTLND